MGRGKRTTITVFCALVVSFATFITLMIYPGFRAFGGLPFMIASVVSFFLLGVALIFLTRRQNITGPLRKFLLLTLILKSRALRLFLSQTLYLKCVT